MDATKGTHGLSMRFSAIPSAQETELLKSQNNTPSNTPPPVRPMAQRPDLSNPTAKSMARPAVKALLDTLIDKWQGVVGPDKFLRKPTDPSLGGVVPAGNMLEQFLRKPTDPSLGAAATETTMKLMDPSLGVAAPAYLQQSPRKVLPHILDAPALKRLQQSPGKRRANDKARPVTLKYSMERLNDAYTAAMTDKAASPEATIRQMSLISFPISAQGVGFVVMNLGRLAAHINLVIRIAGALHNTTVDSLSSAADNTSYVAGAPRSWYQTVADHFAKMKVTMVDVSVDDTDRLIIRPHKHN